jgi:hypothetical protein
MTVIATLEEYQCCHQEAILFFGSELTLLKEAVNHISDERIEKVVLLLISCGQTGAAILQLANQIDTFTNESVMLARSFIEKTLNFCYASVCDDGEYQAFLLHPVYKHFHNLTHPKLGDDLIDIENIFLQRKIKQEKLKTLPIVQKALRLFSESNPNLNWTKKSLNQRLQVIEERGRLLDVFFTISKLDYYSDASETLHGSLYGCTYNVGTFDQEFDSTKTDELNKKLYKNNTCVLLHLGMLIHECLTMVSYSNPIEDIWQSSYKNRRHALNLLFPVETQKNINSSEIA